MLANSETPATPVLRHPIVQGGLLLESTLNLCRHQGVLISLEEVHDTSMLILGLTGGIATGKSTVSNLFRGKNVTVIDCDEIAHYITKKVMFRPEIPNFCSFMPLECC